MILEQAAQAYGKKRFETGYPTTIKGQIQAFKAGWNARGNSFLQGYACAVANMCRLNGEADTVTRELFRYGIGNMSNLKDTAIDQSDLEILNKYFK